MRTTIALVFTVFAAGPLLRAAEPSGVDYLRDVKPILTRRCVSCHGTLKQRGGLRLDTAQRILQGGESGSAVEPRQAAESLVVIAVTGEDGWRMPPEGEGEALKDDEIRLLKAWIDAGATAPREDEPPDPRQHWAFRPPVRPETPVIKNTYWVKNPIDAFLVRSHEQHGLTPVAAADRATLLRRVSLDLTGLVPTPQELGAFLDDPAEDAYEKVVERLLDSPRYGERWGRHWMDVWRYSDWDGYGAEVRESQPHVWRWRDWIVESLNADKGYDRMIVEMLAADEAAPGDDSALRATGFLVRNWYKFNRNVWLDNIIEHTSKAFLGITMNCARCHDHKYDPITQHEYYQLRAFFEPHEIRTDRIPGQPDTTKDGLVRVYDAKLEQPTFLFRRGDEKDPDKGKALTPRLPAIFGDADLEIGKIEFSKEIAYPGLRAFIREEALKQARDALVVAKAEVARQKGKPGAPVVEKALAASEAAMTAMEARLAADQAKHQTPPRSDSELLARLAAIAERQAAFLKAGVEVARVDEKLRVAAEELKSKPNDSKAKKTAADLEKQLVSLRKAYETAQEALSKTDASYTKLSPTYPATSTGRRLALARWIGSTRSPLTARVAVNHVWMRHFGTPLVPTPENFGVNGKPPTHPELLDWLADEFVQRGWSFKALHRRIVTSNAYRMSATPSSEGEADANLAADRTNQYYWRMNPRRMEAEEVRDNVLAIAGSLDTAMGGPDLDPSAGESSARRSLYFRHSKEKRMAFLRQFDSPSVVSCYRRSESVVPQQALALANSKLTLEQARALTRSIAREDGPRSDFAFVESAFLRILGRRPTGDERRECEAYLHDLAQRLGEHPAMTTSSNAESPAEHARASLVHVLYNHNDFVTVR